MWTPNTVAIATKRKPSIWGKKLPLEVSLRRSVGMTAIKLEKCLRGLFIFIEYAFGGLSLGEFLALQKVPLYLEFWSASQPLVCFGCLLVCF
ncbi:MAG: hypothetical protein ABSA29_20935 [Terriglobales bacterium]|jgi:hypothetical protein